MFATKEEFKMARAQLVSLMGNHDPGVDTLKRNLAITLLVGGPWGGHEQTDVFCQMVLADTEKKED